MKVGVNFWWDDWWELVWCAMNIKLLTSGTNGGSTMPASSLFQLILLKNWCNLTSRAPYRPFRHPKRAFTVFVSSCWHNDLASSQNLSEYFSGSSYTRARAHTNININIKINTKRSGKVEKLVSTGVTLKRLVNDIVSFCALWHSRTTKHGHDLPVFISPSHADPLLHA